ATVKFQSSTYQVNEGAGQITVRLDVTGIRDVAVIARLNTANIGATAGSDYTSIVDKNITILPSVTVISETIAISEDGILENNETFSVTVASRSLPHLVTAGPAVAIVTIEDNDVVSVRFSQSSYSTEEELTQLNVQVIVAGQLQRPVQLSLSTRDQSATQGNDYQQNTVSLTFNPGDPQERNVPIQILEDTLIENTETLSVELTTTDTDIVFSNGNTASIIITDDDVASVYIPNDAYSYNEHDGTANIPVILQGNLAIPVTARWSTQHNTATWPSDFTVITNRDIVFRPGEPALQQLQVNILDDDVVESTEQFSVVLNTQDAKVTIGTHGTATVSIIDNDQLRVNFSSSRYEADEDSGFALVGLVLHDVLETTTSV
ncbi:partial, partial [Paramuricea clavata]